MNERSPDKSTCSRKTFVAGGIASWPFEVDPVHLFAWAENVFTKQECEKIIKLAQKQKAIQSRVGFGHAKVKRDKSLRLSGVRWLAPTKEFEWVFRKITDTATNLNKTFFKFDLFGAIEGLQFTSYKAPGGKYGRHVDRSLGGVVRKLSLTVQLSDPATYEGGDLCFYTSDEPLLAPKKQGACVVFPSFVQHEVREMTRGQRYSLVVWITGKPFK